MISCKAQAFCQTDANAGSPEENTHATATKPLQQDTVPREQTVSSAQLRHQYVQKLSTENFEHLVHRIGAAYAKVIAVTSQHFRILTIHLSAVSTKLTDIRACAGMPRSQAFAISGTQGMSGVFTT